MALAPPRLASVLPVVVDASAAVTSVHASTFEISFGDGDGEGLLDEAEGELDPHAATRRPTTATRAIAVRARAKADRFGAGPAGLNLEPVVSQGRAGLSTGPNGAASPPIELRAVPR